jgi:2-methylisocitrate lyase-like PEP mutase family enzyme
LLSGAGGGCTRGALGDQRNSRSGVPTSTRRSEGCARYAEAGADCLYAPRIDKPEHVAAIVSAVSPKPVNLLINAPFATVAEAAQVGVRRISVGGTLARTAWSGFLQAAREIADEGTLSRFERLPNVNALFGR